jgi:rhomboid family GlyGly-CTERM serine protease
MFRYPLTLTITCFAILTALSPQLTHHFQLDFDLVREGQWWRLITGHFTHHGFSHLFWDLIMFVVLSTACEHRHRKLYPYCIGASLLLISTAIAVCCPTMQTYRGLSGIDTGLFVWFILDQVQSSRRANNRPVAIVSLFAVTGLFVKLIYELNTGNTLFVESDTFVPLVESHLAGATTGLASFALTRLHHKRSETCQFSSSKHSLNNPETNRCALTRT